LQESLSHVISGDREPVFPKKIRQHGNTETALTSTSAKRKKNIWLGQDPGSNPLHSEFINNDQTSR
jgi:hypothetical protein